jgi:hypothetical protein
MLQNLLKDEEVASKAKIQMEEEQENYKYRKQREKLLRETSMAKTKAEEFHYFSNSTKRTYGGYATNGRTTS